MIKKILPLLLIISFWSCDPAALQQILDSEGGGLTTSEIGQGLKSALNIGIDKGVSRLSASNGYFKSPYKILLPPEARKVTQKLQGIPGFSNIENIVLEKINRGAEDAAKRAKPIFVKAIKQMTFKDAMGILMGGDGAATDYLHRSTYTSLYNEFNPVIVQSLDKFQARKYWSDAVTAYNRIPFVDKVNTKLDDYVTNQALKGLFAMVQKEETKIRHNISARKTDLLRRVFAKQDK